MERSHVRRRLARASYLVLGWLTVAPPAAVQSQYFEAVWVHGPAVQEPRLIRNSDIAMCLWGFGYNFYESRVEATSRNAAEAVVLSFIRAEDLSSNSEANAEPPDPLQPMSGHHIRILIAPEHDPIVTQFKKPVDSNFQTRMAMLGIGEAYYSSHRIPTRLDKRGDPVVVSLSEAEVQSARARFDEVFGQYLPACRP